MCDRLLDSVCRLCLRDNFSLKRIFHNPCFSNEPLSKIIEKIYDLKICEGDGLPWKICVPCMWKVLEFDTYRKNVRHAEEELRKLLSRTCNKSNEVSEEGIYNVTELTAEREMVSTGIGFKDNYPENDARNEELEAFQNVASDPLEGIDNDTEVFIKNEIDIDEWDMPQDMLPEEDILENVKTEAGEEVLKDTEVWHNNFIETEEQQQEDIHPEKDTSMSSESCDIHSSDCLGYMDKNFENVSSINNSSVVSTSGISGKNKKKCEESVKNVLLTEKESLFSLKSKSGDNLAKSGSSSSGMAVQSIKKQFVCDICNKSYDTKQPLGRHIRVHYDDRPFKCRECGQSFKLESTKIVHELIHLKKQKESGGDENKNNKKSHVCEICKKEFSTRQTLHSHSNLHINKYSCTFCGKSCASKYLLNRHSRIHTNEKPFSCEVCKRTFNRKENLKSHITIHSDDRSFQCNVCDKRFRNKHLRNKHELFHLRRK